MKSTTFGKRLTEVRKAKKFSQDELAKKLADLLGSTVGYLLGENEESNLFKDPEMLERFKAIKAFKEEDKEKIYFTLDALIHEVSNRKRYAHK